VRRLLTLIPPGSGAVVMATGIVSTTLELTGRRLLADVLLALALAAWTLLAVTLVVRVTVERDRALDEASAPPALAGVAGTGVLGTRMTLEGWPGAGLVLLAVGAVGWVVLQGRVWRRWRTPAVGASFLVAVSTQALAVLCAALAPAYRAPGFVIAGAVMLACGVVLYAVVLVRFDLRELLVGRGDHWVAGGALAICALAAGRLTLAARELGAPDGLEAGLAVAAPVLAVAAALWLPPLVLGELARPRPAFDARRWATVFPVAMYGAMTLSVGRVVGSGALTSLARAWVWVGLAVWALVAAGMLARARALLAAPRA